MIKHNKKRNTAFIFEALSHEMTKAIVAKDEHRKNKVVNIVKAHFKKDTQLRKELDLFRSMAESSETQEMASKIVKEAKSQHAKINKEKLFLEQTALINDINKSLSKKVFSNFVGNYKHLATISKMFSEDSDIKSRVLLEDTVVSSMILEDEVKVMKPVDGAVYKTFVKKFNEEYSKTLSESQKSLLSNYVNSVSDNGLGFKVYLNEEVGRLKNKVQESMSTDEISSDKEMTSSTEKVYDILEELASKPIDEEVIGKVMSIQNFVEEVDS